MSDAKPSVTDDGLVDYLDKPGPSRTEREAWPYITHMQIGLRNGREAGAWICGHLFGRAMHGERGLRVCLLTDYVDGAVVALVAAGVTVQHHSTQDANFTPDEKARAVIDVWV